MENVINAPSKDGLKELLKGIASFDDMEDWEDYPVYAEIYFYCKYTLEMFNVEDC